MMPRNRDTRSARGEGAGDFEEALAAYLDRLNAGETLNPEAILAENPTHGARILERLEDFAGLGSSEADSDPLGTLGDFKLLRRIGRGGMGVVYEAWEGSMDRRVALKVLPSGVAADDRAFQRFLREARAAGKLNHPNVVPVYATGVKERTPYYAMELVEGETLAQVIDRLKPEDGPIGVDPFGGREEGLARYSRIALAIAGAAEGLQHAHSRGVVHRDLKPSNLILERDGRLRILDFGLARLEGQESLTNTGDFMGTVLYMSPEQAMARRIPVDHRTDVYSLGASLYETLALRPPFEGKSHQDTLSRIIFNDPPSPRTRDPRIPQDLETIVLKCLRKDPADRYGTAEALAQDLRRFARGDPIEARPQSRWERARRRAWRNRRMIAVGLVLTLALTAAGWLFLDRLGRDRDRRERAYAEKVESAALRLELASQRQRGGFELVSANDLPGSPGIDPVELALKDLEDAVALVPERPDARYHRARALLLLSRGDEAREALEPLAGARPPFVPAVNALADLHERLGEADQAEALFQEVEKLATDGWSKAWVEAWRGWREKKLGDAIAACTRLLAECSQGREPFLGCTMTARLSRGSAYLESGEHMKAARDFAMAQALVPDAVQPALLEARAWQAMGRAGDVAKILEETYARAAHADEVALIAADMYLEVRDEKVMHDWLDRVSVPSVRETIRCQNLFALGHLEDSVKAGRKAVAHDPRNPNAWDRLGFMLMQQGHLAEAHEVFEAGLKVAPDYSDLHHCQGSVYLREGEFEKAANCFQRAAQLNKQSDRSELYKIAAAYVMLYQRDKEAVAIAEAHRRNPRNVEGEMMYAKALFQISRLEESLQAAERGIEAGPNFSYTYSWKAAALLVLGREEETLATWRTAQPFIPVSYQFFLWPALLLEERGRPQEALTDLVAALKPFASNEYVHLVLARILKKCRGRLEFSRMSEVRAAIEDACMREPGSRWARHSLALAELLQSPPAGDAIDRALSLLLGVLDEQNVDPVLGVNASQSLFEIATLSESEGRGSILDRLPGLPSPAAMDALFAGPEVLAGVEWVPERFLDTGMTSAGAQARLLYLEACVLEKGRDFQGAAELLAAIPAEATSPEVTLRLARVLRDAGNPRWAEEAIRAVLATSPGSDRRLWSAWLEVNFVDLARSPTDVLAVLPAAPVTRDAIPQADCYGNDLRWLLERLSAGEPIRINCGGEDYQDPRGRLFGRDRFALSGKTAKPWAKDIAGTDMAMLFQSERYFEPWLPPETSAYAIPLPPGRYHVRLHFAELFYAAPGCRSFNVSIQGKMVIKNLDIDREVGFTTAMTKGNFEAVVERGDLEIRFHPLNARSPKISAIEVERAE